MLARWLATHRTLVTLALFACGSGCSCNDKATGSAADGGGPDGSLAPFRCNEDSILCEGTVAKVCDGKGGFKRSEDCGKRNLACLSSSVSSAGLPLILGCVQCSPGDASCKDGKASLCREDGTGFDSFDCDPLQGMTCEASGCKGVCAPPEVTTSYIGCDYYPTVTLNPVWSGFDFAVAVSNASDAEAHVVVTQGDKMVRELTIGVKKLEIIKLDWVSMLKGGDQDACQIPPEPGDSRLVRDGAYRLRSNHPVTVYQLSPLQYELGKGGTIPSSCPVGTKCPGGVVPECLSYTNDASLLMPATALSGDYTVMSWPSHGNTSSFYAVTATADGTTLTLKGRGGFRQGGGVDSNGQGEVHLDRGDVLEVLSKHGDNSDDATGSVIHADHPVQVIGGHSCANIPDADTAACDHLEQALFPSQILGKEYIASYPAAVASQSPYVVRIVAVSPNTKLQFDPALMPAVTLGPDSAPLELHIGSFTRGGTSEPPSDVRITADKPIMVAQYMLGQTAVPSGAGDPSMTLTVPVAQYRNDYIFTASTTYDSNFINVIALIGTNITLDDKPLDGEAHDVGKSDYKVIRTRLSNDGSGVYRIHGDAPFGLLVYGYGRYTSYMYPGGLDLKRITVIGPD